MPSPLDSGMAQPRQVLREMGLPAIRLRRLGQQRNAHWLAETPFGHIVLRRFAAEHSHASVQYELRVIDHLARRGWPVSEPVAPLLELDGVSWYAARYLPGRTRAPRSAAGNRAEQRERGRLLARLHADLATLAGIGQRDGFRRADEGLFARRKPGLLPVEEVLRRYERRYPETGGMLRRFAERANEQLAALLPHAPAPIVIHGDFAPWNLLFQQGALSGILDFEFAHLDLRVADFVLSWRAKYDAVVRGYEEVAPLEPIERALLVPIYWSWIVDCAIATLDQGSTQLDWEVSHLTRTEGIELPSR